MCRTLNVWLCRLLGFRSWKSHDGCEIVGTRTFVDATKNALHQLRENGYGELVLETLVGIRQGLRSTGYVRIWPSNVYVVGGYTWHLPVLGYAGAIAYHAYRNQIYWGRGCKFQDTEVDFGLELECAEFERKVLRKLKAPHEVAKQAWGLSISEVSDLDTRNRRRNRRGSNRYPVGKVVWEKWSREPDIRITISGPRTFVERMKEALDLLESIPAQGELALRNICRIRATKRVTLSYVSTTSPKVLIGWEEWDASSPVVLAGLLAHEAYHNVLYREAVAKRWVKDPGFVREKFASVTAERACLEFERQVVSALGGVDADARIEQLAILGLFPVHNGDPTNLYDRFSRHS